MPSDRPSLSPGIAPRHSRIMGVGGYRPRRVVPNSEVVEAIDSSDQWIQERSGIKSRRWAGDDETIVAMSTSAAKDALAMAGITPEQVSCVLVSTVTFMYNTPAAAPLIALELGATNAAAFDISAACAGYCHGIAIASDMVKSGTSDYVVVIGVERLSDFTDPTDRGTAFIFGDGAGATVVGPSDTVGIGPTIWGADGAKWDAIVQREPWSEVLAAGKTKPAIIMQGQSVFRWAVWSMAPVAQQAITAAGITINDLDAFIPHQANMRIIDSMIKTLKLPEGIPVARDIAETANTSAASIPLATERMLREGQAPHGGLALQIGFGAGLVYAAQVVVLP